MAHSAKYLVVPYFCDQFYSLKARQFRSFQSYCNVTYPSIFLCVKVIIIVRNHRPVRRVKFWKCKLWKSKLEMQRLMGRAIRMGLCILLFWEHSRSSEELYFRPTLRRWLQSTKRIHCLIEGKQVYSTKGNRKCGQALYKVLLAVLSFIHISRTDYKAQLCTRARIVLGKISSVMIFDQSILQFGLLLGMRTKNPVETTLLISIYWTPEILTQFIEH
jgi:hypothetical protein